MALTDTFVKNVKSTKPVGDKYADRNGMYLLVTPASKYWRLDYRHFGKRKTLALGVYPSTTLAKARLRAADARTLIADGVDPCEAKRQEKRARIDSAQKTFEVVARLWLQKTSTTRAPSTQDNVTGWLKRDVFPFIGQAAIATLTPKDILLCLQRMEARGVMESTHRVKQICGQVFRFAVASDLVKRDVTADLKGALSVVKTTSYAAITDPRHVGALLRSIYGYAGHRYSVAALKLSALLFVRPGELRSAEWAHVDLDAAEWWIPGARMKMKADHLVPLSRPCPANERFT